MTSHWTHQDWLDHHTKTEVPGYAASYHAMYSSHWDAIVTDPRCMQVPVDDHLVHRGDGVFETLLCSAGALYNLDAHIHRLVDSAGFIGLQAPGKQDLSNLVLQTFRAAGKDNALGRLLLGRGPGGFGVDPAEGVSPSVYLTVYGDPKPFMDLHPGGARVALSKQPVKSGGLAAVKTCNYLPNALMKAEAAAANCHFAVGVDPNGYLSESFTENIAIVDTGGTLRLPRSNHFLPGTTYEQVRRLAIELGLPSNEEAFTPKDACAAREVMLIGTTAYVTSAVQVNGTTIGNGTPGPIALKLDHALRRDVAQNSSLRTPLFD